MSNVTYPNWFVPLTPEEFAQKGMEQAEINKASKKEQRLIRNNLKMMVRAIKRRTDMHPGIQKSICPCGVAHDEFICVKDTGLLIAPEKERVGVTCRNCDYLIPRIMQAYGEERGKKVMQYLWGKGELK